ncbi:H-NS family nucleoid-associated regulatory protein [Burkholderia guangdongensis]|uniref:H-NS family nucleoid-associated regulatory protein n=1 Tax=Burkholderia guangdongensis TaxID=1792500 RepID=UPI0015C967BC|nr:H-NS family nucleoid-associated regulatory protein [Burkholderia guangdongensis]
MKKYSELKVDLAELQSRMEAARAQEVRDAISKIKSLISEFGITAQELGYAERPKRGRPPKTF